MALKQTGVELIAKGGPEFNAALKSADKTVQAFGNDVKQSADKVNASGSSFEKVASKVDSFGRNARIGFSSAGQAARLFGADIDSIVGPAAMAADAVGDIVGSVGALGATAGVLGGVVVGIGFLVSKVQEQNAAMVESAKANDTYLLSLRHLGEEYPKIAEQINKVAQAQVNLDQSNRRIFGAGSANIYIHQNAADAYAREKEKLEEMVQATDKSYDALENLRASTGYATSAAYEHEKALNAESMALDYAAAAANRLADAMGDTRGEAINDYREGARSVSEMNTKAWLATHAFQEGVGWVEKLPPALEKSAQSASRIASQFRSMVESSLNFTPVTNEDMVASAAGTYTDKWDEFLRRAKAVQSGTDPAQFGEEFKSQLEGLNMPLDEVIRKFQNFQLFVNGANFDLVNFDAITTQIEDQLTGMAGKAALTDEAMKRVWANLSPTAKAALATTGIENAEDAMKAFLDPAGKAKDQVTDLNKEINNTPELKTTTFDVKKAPTFDPVLAQIADDLSIIPDAADILVTIYYESANKPPDTSGTLGDGTAVPPGYASGGAGVFGADQLVRVHAGEGFWFSGTQWQYPIPPSFSNMIDRPMPGGAYYGGDTNAPINVSINANVASNVDVDYLANRVANQIRDRMLTVRRSGT